MLESTRWATALAATGLLTIAGASGHAAEFGATWTGAADAAGNANDFDWDDAGNWDTSDYPDADHPNAGDAYHLFFDQNSSFDDNDDALMLNGDREVLSLNFAADIDKGFESVTFDGGRDPSPSSNTLTITNGEIDDKSDGFIHFGPLVKFGTSTVTINREDGAGSNRELRFNQIEMGDGDLLIKTGGGTADAVADNSSRFYADMQIDGGTLRVDNDHNGWGDGFKSDTTTRQTVTANSGGTFQVNSGGDNVNFDFIVNAGGTLNLDTGSLTLTGTLTGDGTLSNTNGGADNVIAGDASGFTGDLFATQGNWVVQNTLGTSDITADASSSGTGLVTTSSGLIVFSDDDVINLLNGAEGDFADETFDLTSLDSTQSHVLVDYTSGSIVYSNDVNDLLNASSASAGWGLTDTGSQITAVIPEPASLALLGLGGTMILLRRRQA